MTIAKGDPQARPRPEDEAKAKNGQEGKEEPA